MFCYNCGEENPDEAKYCKNCGALLKKEETIRKVEVVESPNYRENTQQKTETATTSKKDSNDWIACCLCIIVIFIVFAIFGSF